MLDKLKINIRSRADLDRQMSIAWLVVYFLPIIIAALFVGYFLVSSIDLLLPIDFTTPYDYNDLRFGFVGELTVFGSIAAINFFGSMFLVYMLIDRIYNHFERQKSVFEELIDTIGSLARVKKVEDSLIPLKRSIKETNFDNVKKNAILWAILSALVPFIQLYVYYFLMKDFYGHKSEEDSFWEKTGEIFNELDIEFSFSPKTEEITNRNFIQYLILLIVTMGLFGVYWIYILIEDPNKHFKLHSQIEKELISALERF